LLYAIPESLKSPFNVYPFSQKTADDQTDNHQQYVLVIPEGHVKANQDDRKRQSLHDGRFHAFGERRENETYERTHQDGKGIHNCTE
jgi:hypothetical protein